MYVVSHKQTEWNMATLTAVCEQQSHSVSWSQLLEQNCFSYPPTAQQSSPVSQDILTVEASRSRSHTLHSVRLLWTSDRKDEETSN